MSPYHQFMSPTQMPDFLTCASRPPDLRRPSVLVVEFCDAEYARLKAQLEDYGFQTGRAVSGAAVASSFSRLGPDLVLLNADMPDESGWLITAKLRIAGHQAPVWLYAQREPPSQAVWQLVSGVNEVIVYDGSPVALASLVRSQLQEWLKTCDEPVASRCHRDAA